MAGKGWMRLHREILDKAIFHNEKLLKVFIWCTLKATHEEYDQLVGRQLVHLFPGLFVTGRLKASEELRLKPSTVWDYLKVLESNNTIDIKSDSKFSVITVVNWALYQSGEAISDSEPDSGSDNKSTANQHKQEHKNIKKKEVYTSEVDDFFEEIWSLYPNKKGKAAIKSATKKKLIKVGKDTLVKSLERYKRDLEVNTWKQPMNGSTWFNGRYADYLEAETEHPTVIDLTQKPNDFRRWE
jgi:hypothetical protein